ncbi:TPA: hypothetical protein N0F65_003012 [Lagenidium giganteum]|uniref:Uncharacterized protein n=1 Tax=Lagenidium giganteum TaxID=4803 RepID=A0AAV2YV02_9STRA|nr:TPA: hypothetical protein N0F65_003012 [Lagenidium giganteum]
MVVTPGGSAAPLMDFLAQTCEEAHAVVQDMKVEDVSEQLAQAVTAMQQSLRSVRESVHEILDDPDKLAALGQYMRMTDQQLIEAGAPVDAAEEDDEQVRSMMVFADNMCSVMDTALSTISQDELDLAAQLSLGIAQRLFEAGHSLFVSMGDEERTKASADRANRITIEELADDADDEATGTSAATATKRRQLRRKQEKHTAALRTYVEGWLKQAREQAVEHPYLAAAATTACLPFIGLAIPMASIVGLALVVEKYYPEHASLTMEMLSNFVQMMKLWLLLIKISARQFGIVAKQCFASWYEYASTNGFIATGKELASTCCNLGWLGASRMYYMMGCGASALKKELKAVKEEAEKAQAKHAEEVEALKAEKRLLEYKLNVLQGMAAQAQLEAEKATELARVSEDKMKALKWELVRKLSVATSLSPTASVSSSLSALSGTSSPRVSLQWKVKDVGLLRRSSTTVLHTHSSDLPTASDDPTTREPAKDETPTHKTALHVVAEKPGADSRTASRTNSRPAPLQSAQKNDYSSVVLSSTKSPTNDQFRQKKPRGGSVKADSRTSSRHESDGDSKVVTRSEHERVSSEREEKPRPLSEAKSTSQSESDEDGTQARRRQQQERTGSSSIKSKLGSKPQDEAAAVKHNEAAGAADRMSFSDEEEEA